MIQLLFAKAFSKIGLYAGGALAFVLAFAGVYLKGKKAGKQDEQFKSQKKAIEDKDNLNEIQKKQAKIAVNRPDEDELYSRLDDGSF